MTASINIRRCPRLIFLCLYALCVLFGESVFFADNGTQINTVDYNDEFQYGLNVAMQFVYPLQYDLDIDELNEILLIFDESILNAIAHRESTSERDVNSCIVSYSLQSKLNQHIDDKHNTAVNATFMVCDEATQFDVFMTVNNRSFQHTFVENINARLSHFEQIMEDILISAQLYIAHDTVGGDDDVRYAELDDEDDTNNNPVWMWIIIGVLSCLVLCCTAIFIAICKCVCNLNIKPSTVENALSNTNHHQGQQHSTKTPQTPTAMVRNTDTPHKAVKKMNPRKKSSSQHKRPSYSPRNLARNLKPRNMAMAHGTYESDQVPLSPSLGADLNNPCYKHSDSVFGPGPTSVDMHMGGGGGGGRQYGHPQQQQGFKPRYDEIYVPRC
eukprot:CAMPEP_0202684966 /NCGR_PEP_ID=MMETSP1385-20130828/578_1 /ASSEMBLY_ACC=CAM_ASM_000861 /TAXON_ID=933848 /ORGANISM="Elphidium margaritaceum" /LENGTH=384 /DNA_ID=CAMNT_0049339193 /DNA_START=27 /DNA_END=1184 /DNA_ORIENTATION=+